MDRSATAVLVLGLLLSGSSWAQQKVNLPEFLELARNANLDLKIEKAKEDSADAKAIGMAIPPPMVGANWMKEESGNKARGFEVNQMVPFPSKLIADRSARQHEAFSQSETKRAREKEILARAKLLYLSLWNSQEKLTLLQEKTAIIKDHIKLARSTVRSDSFAAVHLLKSESELDLLENETSTAKQALREKQLEVAVFLNEDAASVRVAGSEPKLSDIPDAFGTTSHQVLAMQHNLESAEAREWVARSAWLPDFNLRYRKMGATSMAGPYNEIMVGVTVPFLFFWEPYSESKHASAERVQKEYELEKEKRSVDAKKSGLLTRAQALKEQIQTLAEKLIPRAEKRAKMVHNLAPRDMETLQDHRETMEALPDLKMKALDLRLQYEESVAELDQYGGEKEGTAHE